MNHTQYALKSLRSYIYSAVFLSCLLCITIYGLFIRFEEDGIGYAREKSLSAETQMSVTIGEGKVVKIYGYTSPKSLVKLTHPSLQNHTYANEEGYFEFVDFLPYIVEGLCISSQDQFGRVTQPVCLPTLDLHYSSEIGPILLPPTISVDQGIYYISDEVIISGQTIPNTEVKVSSFINKEDTAGSYPLPNLEVHTDEGGNYSVVTKTKANEDYRTFVRVDYLNQLSPLSNKLFIKIYPFWYIFIQALSFLLSFLKSHLIETIIIAEILLLVLYLLRRYLHHWFLARITSEIVLREKNMIEPVAHLYPTKPLDLAIEPYNNSTRSLIKI